MRKFYKFAIIITLMINIGLVGFVFNLYQNQTNGSSVETNVINTNITEFSSELSQAIEKASKSVVAIKTNKQGIYSYGSGVIVNQSEGLVDIITNAAIINNAETVEVLFANGQTLSANILGSDTASDLGLVQASVDFNVPVIDISSSQSLKLGQFVAVIGSSPLNISNNAALGIISHVATMIDMDLNGDEINDWQVLTVQSDANVSTFNTGGAMINLKGELVGIASSRLANTLGLSAGSLSVAIPSDEALVIGHQLKEKGSVTRALLGINVIDIASLTTYQRSYLGIDLDMNQGMYVTGVNEQLSGSLVGLQVGDVITSIGNKSINSLADYRKALYVNDDQSSISITYIRNNESNSVSLELVR